MERDEFYMRRCIELAKQAADNGDVPVGAVVVRQSDGEIVGEGFNRRELDRSSLSHAELIAIDQASKKLGGWRLIDCVLYVTLEPCAMCGGAIVNSRVERLVFGADDL
ncbi:tRNA-specific adenosine deaminase, partial [Pyramidobacter sp. C12-8]